MVIVYRVQSPVTCKLGDTNSQRVKSRNDTNTCIYKTFPAWHPTIAAGVLAQVRIGFPTSVLLAQGSEGKFEMYEAKQVFNIEAYIPLRKNGLHGRRSYNSLASSKRTECDACGSTMRQKKSEFLCRTCPIDSFKLSGTLLESRCGKALSSMYYSRCVVEQFTSCIELWWRCVSTWSLTCGISVCILRGFCASALTFVWSSFSDLYASGSWCFLVAGFIVGHCFLFGLNANIQRAALVLLKPKAR